jgi:predicted RNase H-like nuclease (RuvC/YqgF family)
MFGLRLFRFRSRKRDQATDEQRLALIRKVVRSAVADAQAESKGLRARIASARSSVTFLIAKVDDGEAGGAELTSLEQELMAAERRLAQLNDHLAVLRNIEVAAGAGRGIVGTDARPNDDRANRVS